MRNERGGVAVVFALCLLPIIGIVGLMIDTGGLLADHAAIEWAAMACALQSAEHPEAGASDLAPLVAALSGAQLLELDGVNHRCRVAIAAWMPSLLTLLGAEGQFVSASAWASVMSDGRAHILGVGG